MESNQKTVEENEKPTKGKGKVHGEIVYEVKKNEGKRRKQIKDTVPQPWMEPLSPETLQVHAPAGKNTGKYNI